MAPQPGLGLDRHTAATWGGTDVHLWQQISGQDCWFFPALIQGSCKNSWTGKCPWLPRAAPHSASPCTALYPQRAAGQQVTSAHRQTVSAKRPLPKDFSGGSVVRPSGLVNKAVLAPFLKKFNSALILYVCLSFGNDNKTPKFRRATWVVRGVCQCGVGVGHWS